MRKCSRGAIYIIVTQPHHASRDGCMDKGSNGEEIQLA
jgi:hypothetical protein